MIGKNDARLKQNAVKAQEEAKKKAKEVQVVREVYVLPMWLSRFPLTFPVLKSPQLSSSNTTRPLFLHTMFLSTRIFYRIPFNGNWNWYVGSRSGGNRMLIHTARNDDGHPVRQGQHNNHKLCHG